MGRQYLPELTTPKNMAAPVAVISPETEALRKESQTSKNFLNTEYLVTKENQRRGSKEKKPQKHERDKRHHEAHAMNVMRSFMSTSRHSADHEKKGFKSTIMGRRMTNPQMRTMAQLPKIKLLRNTEDIIRKSQNENVSIRQLGKSIEQSQKDTTNTFR